MPTGLRQMPSSADTLGIRPEHLLLIDNQEFGHDGWRVPMQLVRVENFGRGRRLPLRNQKII